MTTTRHLTAEMRETGEKFIHEGEVDEYNELPGLYAAALHDLDVADGELSTMTQAVGLATTAVPDMEIDVCDPIGMMHKVVAEVSRLRTDLAEAQTDYKESLRCTDELADELGRARNTIIAMRHKLATLHGLRATDNVGAYSDAQEEGCCPSEAWDTFCKTLFVLDFSSDLANTAQLAADHDAEVRKPLEAQIATLSDGMTELMHRVNERNPTEINEAPDRIGSKYYYLTDLQRAYHRCQRILDKSDWNLADHDAVVRAPLEAQFVGLRESVRHFQQQGHHPDCASNPLDDKPLPCTCGYHKATVALSDTAAYALDCFATVRADERRRVLEAIDIEDEHPGDMPDDMWQTISNDKQFAQEYILSAMRLTKKHIRKRIEQLAPPPEED